MTTPEEFEAAMRQIDNSIEAHTESAHRGADDLMCKMLRELGYGDAVKVFEDMPKWYA